MNPNPLREAFGADVGRVSGGRWHLGEAPGLGIDALPDALPGTITWQREARVS